MHLAALLGHRFSVVTVLDAVVPLIEDLAGKYGLAHKLASIRSVDIPVLELGDHQRLVNALADESVKAVEEDGAHAIVFGCTGMRGCAAGLKATLAERGYPGIPVIDPVVAAFKIAEALVDLGLTPSQRTYPTPREKALPGLREPHRRPRVTGIRGRHDGVRRAPALPRTFEAAVEEILAADRRGRLRAATGSRTRATSRSSSGSRSRRSARRSASSSGRACSRCVPGRAAASSSSPSSCPYDLVSANVRLETESVVEILRGRRVIETAVTHAASAAATLDDLAELERTIAMLRRADAATPASPAGRRHVPRHGRAGDPQPPARRVDARRRAPARAAPGHARARAGRTSR